MGAEEIALIAAALLKAALPEVLDRLPGGSEHTDRVRRNADIADAVDGALADNPTLAVEALRSAGLSHLLKDGIK